MRERAYCPRCEEMAVRLEVKAKGTGGAVRVHAVQPRGGDLPPGPLYQCRVHGAFTVSSSRQVRESRVERRARLAEALRDALSDLGAK